MRLPVFELVDKTCALLKDNEPMLQQAAGELTKYFYALFARENECLINIATRVKGEESLREKILRKNMYKRYAYAEGILQNLSDLIGVRVECRFLEEESLLFDRLRRTLTAQEEGFSFDPKQPSVRLDMCTPQPQSQLNGFSIYRIDGLYGEPGRFVRFELQIKAMVHVFWTEVEHEIIYKNNSYLLMDSFMKELLSSAYANLSLVDNQLYLIYKQIQQQSMPEGDSLRESTLRSLFAKGISDIFFYKMRASLGFTLNFRHSCDILSRYILERQDALRQMPAQTMLALFQRINQITKQEIDFEEPLLLEAPFRGREPFLNILADYLLEQMNADYDWNLFFRMLFILEPGNNLEDFSNLLHMLRDRFADMDIYAPLLDIWTEEQVLHYQQWLLVPLAHQLVADGTIQIIYEETIETICGRLRRVVADTVAHPVFPPELPRYKLWQP